MLVTSRCWWLYVVDNFRVLVTGFQWQNGVTNISKLSPTNIVSDIRQQHRCFHNYALRVQNSWLKLTASYIFSFHISITAFFSSTSICFLLLLVGNKEFPWKALVCSLMALASCFSTLSRSFFIELWTVLMRIYETDGNASTKSMPHFLFR